MFELNPTTIVKGIKKVIYIASIINSLINIYIYIYIFFHLIIVINNRFPLKIMYKIELINY